MTRSVQVVEEPKPFCPWWAYLCHSEDMVPVCADFGINPPVREDRPGEADVPEWYALREQLWAQREGLA